MNLVFPLSTAVDTAMAGGKAATLGRLLRAGFPVPDGLVVGPDAFWATVGSEGAGLFGRAENAAELASFLAGLQPSPSMVAALQLALGSWPADALAAVRSSAADEDGPDRSFAGQLQSYLFVAIKDVPGRVADVWRSAFRPRVWAYREQHGLPTPPTPPAVLVQRMVPARAAGVAFSADPVSGRRGVAVIAAVSGVADELVAGRAVGDTYYLRPSGEVERQQLVGSEPVLKAEALRQVGELVRRVEDWFGRPQDIEWAIEGQTVWLLQARPITGLGARSDRDGEVRLWDNSNIVESYGGMTMPLSYSFARHAYEGVYRQFCRLMGVPTATIAQQGALFRNMIGYLHGRVYYNLSSWHRVLALLPGYKHNRRFMEQMMGTRPSDAPTDSTDDSRTPRRAGIQPSDKPGAARPDNPPAPTNALRGLESATGILHLARTVWGLVWNYLTLEKQVRRFRARLDVALEEPCPALSQRDADGLVRYFRSLEKALLTRWDAPLVNDFFAMIFHGVLRRCCESWCKSRDGTLANEWISQQGGLISAEPAGLVAALAEAARPYPRLVRALLESDTAGVEREMVSAPAFSALLRDYLRRFGDRCLEELKLESYTLHEDPRPLYRAIGAMTQRIQSPVAAERVRTGTWVAPAGLSPIRAGLLGWVLVQAKTRVRDRENLRFERTRLFARVRTIFVEVGSRLHAAGELEDPRDIFYLELEEVLGFCEGSGTCADLKGMVEVRRREFQRWQLLPPLPRRFETRGPVSAGLNAVFSAGGSPALLEDREERNGVGCCPGQVRGLARVVTAPAFAEVRPGEILVAEQTDPGWVMLFPAAAGLIVERGSLLSHSAIVARELGLPTVIGLSGVLRWLRTGDEVELDGATGRVARISKE